MKNIPIAIKVILNIVFFVIYSLIGIIFGNFLFGLFNYLLDNPVPGKSDPIHMKIAGIILLVVFILTIILRKYFYIQIHQDGEEEIRIVDEKAEKNEIIDDGKMQIYVNKEIK